MTVALSVLDLSPISAGDDAVTALHNTVDLARHAERWGYRRFWVAEHHFAAVASAAPGVLIGQIAAATSTIRVGAAAVQLGFTTAAAVVETFGTLAAFHPDRLDLGVGRSAQRSRRARAGQDGPAPFLAAQVQALTQPEAATPDFGAQVDDIVALLADDYRVEGMALTVSPGAGAALHPWVFGSSAGRSARVAGSRGLPFVASYHITPNTAAEAVAAYREAFRPSRWLTAPYVVVSADALAADTDAAAAHLNRGYGRWVHAIRTRGAAIPYPDPDRTDPLTDDEQEVVGDRLASQFVGDPATVVAGLRRLQRDTGADELVITSVAHRHADRLRSHELIAQAWR